MLPLDGTKATMLASGDSKATIVNPEYTKATIVKARAGRSR